MLIGAFLGAAKGYMDGPSGGLYIGAATGVVTQAIVKRISAVSTSLSFLSPWPRIMDCVVKILMIWGTFMLYPEQSSLTFLSCALDTAAFTATVLLSLSLLNTIWSAAATLLALP